MTDRDSPLTFGYLDVASLADAPPPDDQKFRPDEGPWVGGYLIVSESGRPLEFHCTAPVVASHAQRILYGKSLRPFVLGEHVGATLVAKAKLRPDVLLIADADAANAARGDVLPTVLLSADAPERGVAIDDLATSSWLLSRDTSADRVDSVAEKLRRLAGAVDLVEPFDRIREAIVEAQRAVDTPATPQETSLRDAA